MRKILAFIVLLMYFSVTTGFVISLHYCMDRYDSAELGTSSDEKCSKCGMHKDGNCCKDEVKVLKLQTSHIASQIAMNYFSSPVAYTSVNEFLLTPFQNFTKKENTIAHSPPLSEQETYIENCVFRI